MCAVATGCSGRECGTGQRPLRLHLHAPVSQEPPTPASAPRSSTYCKMCFGRAHVTQSSTGEAAALCRVQQPHSTLLMASALCNSLLLKTTYCKMTVASPAAIRSTVACSGLPWQRAASHLVEQQDVEGQDY